METKHLSLDLKAEGDEGVIVGYGSVFGNVDSWGDIIAPGAFRATLADRMPKMLWQHDMDAPIGKWEEAREDDRGLFLRGRLMVTLAKAREAYEMVKGGIIDGLSIGYRTRDYEMDGQTRRLKAVDLYEVSLVTIPANDLATITGVKAEDMTERDFEEMLRRQGFSRSAAKIIVADGWKGYRRALRDAGPAGPETSQRDAGAILEHVTRQINSAIQGGMTNV